MTGVECDMYTNLMKVSGGSVREHNSAIFLKHKWTLLESLCVLLNGASVVLLLELVVTGFFQDGCALT